MPLSSFSLATDCKFAFTKVVTNWADLTQGDNQIAFSLNDLDTATWNEAYAAVLPLAGGASATADLRNFTNLAGESAALTKALGVVLLFAPAVAAAPACTLVVKPGASNGLVWFVGATDGLTLRANESFALCGDPAGPGVTVDATHKTLLFSNTGTDAATVTVVIVGSTL